jgi:RNA polymerase-binding transcription factor DksA
MREHLRELIERRLLSRREELRDRLAAFQRERESESLSRDWTEQVTQRASGEILARLQDSVKVELRDVQGALLRLSDGTYGCCRICGALIAPARLYSLPQADCCSRCDGT